MLLFKFIATYFHCVTYSICCCFFRCVEKRDKALALGFGMFLYSISSIPGPIIFGGIIDSTCLSWNFKNGRRGNCQLYDPVLFRYYLHISCATFTFIGTMFDVFVWHYGKNIDIYKDVEDKNEKTKMSLECQPLNK